MANTIQEERSAAVATRAARAWGGLTTREQWVVILLLGIFLTGLAVRWYRTARTDESARPARTQRAP